METPTFRPFETTLLRIVQETADTVTLVLDPGSEVRNYLAGQFLTIDPKQFAALRQQLAFLEKLKKSRELARAYSLSSSPDEPHLAITIKEEPFDTTCDAYPALLSPHLVYGLHEGQHIEVRGFSGTYTLPTVLTERYESVVHLVAGSGIVPNFSMLKWSLVHQPSIRHCLLFSNKTQADIIFATELQRLEAQFPTQLQVIHCLTRETETKETQRVRLGRISRDLLSSVIQNTEKTLFFICGPGCSKWEKKAARTRGEEPIPKFLERMVQLLQELGVQKHAIKKEAYG